jgi:hypothetical protein
MVLLAALEAVLILEAVREVELLGKEITAEMRMIRLTMVVAAVVVLGL